MLGGRVTSSLNCLSPASPAPPHHPGGAVCWPLDRLQHGTTMRTVLFALLRAVAVAPAPRARLRAQHLPPFFFDLRRPRENRGRAPLEVTHFCPGFSPATPF